MNYSHEILTYIQTVKNFLSKNPDASKYFLVSIDEEFFFNSLAQIAEKNFKSFGEPALTKQQFDFLRTTMISLNVANQSSNPKTSEVEDVSENVFIDLRGYHKICYN